MSSNTAGGTKFSIIAKPQRLPSSGGASGELELTYRNYSRSPLDAQVIRASSQDTAVAQVSLHPAPTSIAIPARASRWTSASPATATVSIGAWDAGVSGTTTITAELSVATRPAGQRLGWATIDTDVRVD